MTPRLISATLPVRHSATREKGRSRSWLGPLCLATSLAAHGLLLALVVPDPSPSPLPADPQVEQPAAQPRCCRDGAAQGDRRASPSGGSRRADRASPRSCAAAAGTPGGGSAQPSLRALTAPAPAAAAPAAIFYARDLRLRAPNPCPPVSLRQLPPSGGSPGRLRRAGRLLAQLCEQ